MVLFEDFLLRGFTTTIAENLLVRVGFIRCWYFMPGDRPVRSALSTDVRETDGEFRGESAMKEIAVGVECLLETDEGEKFRPAVYSGNIGEIAGRRFRRGNLQERLLQLFAQSQFRV